MYNQFSGFFTRLDALLARDRLIIIAIDGNCGSGKTTLADYIAELYDCALFHTDDFFLRPFQRTPERYAEPGGNFDRERFFAEVLTPVKAGRDVVLRRFSCRTGTFLPPVTVTYKPLCVVEGTYSLHPLLRGSYDLGLALRADYAVQIRRLEARGESIEDYKRKWIPLENAYFKGTGVFDCADLVVDASDLFPLQG